MQIAGIEKHSSVNGPGVRFCLFLQGCPHHCPGCQNPGTWRPDAGYPETVANVLHMIQATTCIDGVTVSGGEPFFQWPELLRLAKGVKEMDMSLWVYTGYTYEQIDGLRNLRTVLPYIDVLVDGRYQYDLPPTTWAGSSNQRLIDVQESIRQGKAALWNGG